MPRYIDADELKKHVDKYCDIPAYAMEDIMDRIDDCNDADIVPVAHGSWIPCADGEMPECSECGECYDTELGTFPLFCENYKFCPNCGAKMGKKEETT